jgi:uncharacterized protein (DUF58 family)
VVQQPRSFDGAFLRKLEYLHVVARKVISGRVRAERRSRRVGSGLEFADHRAYAPGDDLRILDWNLYGRLDRLLVRLFQEEEDLSIDVLVDTSRSMAAGDGKLDYAARVAAALCYIGLCNLDRVGVQAFSDGLGERLPPGRGKGRIFKVLEFLAGLRAGGPTGIEASMAAFAHRTRRRGVAIVISDFYDPGYVNGLNLLRYHRFEPCVVQVLEPARPGAMRGEVELVDCETGEARQVTVSPRLLAAQHRARDAWLAGLETFCRSRQIPFARASTVVPFEDLVLHVLRRGGILQ